jgi:hypothetical protein
MSHTTMRKTWGPYPKAAAWLWTGVLRPALAYAAAIWYPRIARTKSNLDRLNWVQQLGLLNVANVRRATPTAALEIAYGVEPLDLYLKEAASRTFVRLGQPRGSNDYGHLSKLSKMIPEHGQTSMYDACTAVWMWKRNFTTDISHGSDNTLNDLAYRAYTDGSLLSESKRVGAGALILQNNKQLVTFSGQLMNRNSVFQAEIYAIKMAAEYLTPKCQSWR